MGYYTRFELSITGDNDDSIDHEAQISQVAGYGSVFEDTCKWYNHEKDMREYSKRYPELVFEISGEGEEAGDLWKDYYQNGLMQRTRAKITFDDWAPLKAH